MSINAVAPLAGAWIEMRIDVATFENASPSLHSRERGLKFQILHQHPHLHRVAPLAGAWIEISYPAKNSAFFSVAPLAGAWIEICVQQRYAIIIFVAPLAGAWIEIDGEA